MTEKEMLRVLVAAMGEVRYKLVDLQLTEQERMLAIDNICFEALSTTDFLFGVDDD